MQSNSPQKPEKEFKQTPNSEENYNNHSATVQAQNSNEIEKKYLQKQTQEEKEKEEDKQRQQEYEKKLKSASQKVEQTTFFQLFRFANSGDKFLMIFGGIASFLNGLAFPLFCLVFGKMIDSFGRDNSVDEMVDEARKQFLYLVYIGVGSFFCSWAQMYGWISSGERQVIQLRKAYFNAILKQDIAWFDSVDPNQLATRISTETFAVQGAIGEKVPTYIMTMSTVVGGFAVAYIYGWELSLICTAFLPFIALGAFLFTYMIQNADQKVNNTYTEASGRAEQAIHGIKTVKSLNGQEHEQKFYLVSLKYAYSQAFKWGIYIGLGLGFMWCVVFLDYALGLYFGSVFIEEGYENQIEDRPYTAGDVIIVFFSLMVGSFSLGQATPCIKNFSLGKQAAFKIYQVLDAKPTISPSLTKGIKPEFFQGKIEFQNVEFSYPVKKDQQILKGINLTIQPGLKTALVGESGCGKSTIMQLIERFYDCDSGSVIVDGNNIKDINLSWFRQHVGYVGQEPVLFAGSVRENLLYGKPDATEADMKSVLEQANAWSFVSNLEKGLDTLVGNSGSQLSGGQKQRICIARALLKNPPILLLDEATSALDRTNEKSIQKTLDEVSKNRTTIVIAHRLSTVQNSDKIYVIDNGQLVEQGNHEQLVQLEGKYAALCQNQKKAEEEEEEQKKIEEDGLKHVQEIKNHSQLKNYSNLQSQVNNNQGISIKMPKEDKIVEISENQLKEQEKKQKQLQEKKEQKALNTKLSQLNKDERCYMIFGGIFSFLAGSCFPVIAVYLGNMLFLLAQYGYIPDDEYKSERNENCLAFILIAIASFISNLIQFASWKKVGEGLTYKLRELGFKKILNMRGDWFDLPENSAGTLSSRLGSDTQIVNGLTSTVINIQISNFGALVSGLCIGFIFEWRTTLVALGCFPILAIAGAIQAQFVQGFSEQTDAGYKDSGNLIQEAVVNMRTVTSFGNEDSLEQSYEKKLELPLSIVKPKANKAGFAFGLSQMVLFVIYGLIFFIGAVFVKEYGIDAKDMYIALFAIMNAAMGAGNNNAFMTDIGQAFNAAKNLFAILDSKDEEQLHREEVFDPIKDFSKFKGEIEFKDVVFKYPSRDKYVLNGISFKIKPGQKCALVGPSGCGKSTIMQILLRFYEIEAGSITIDGIDYKEYDIRGLRAQYGVVSQEPILFKGTIRENILYNSQNVTQQQIEQAAEQANAKDFIEKNELENQNDTDKNLGQGYDRQVGPKGSFLSGGQKQRIAIARAIIKSPKILLLDEATSALDNKNEKVVQESLDKLMQGRTTLSIAHRISTIKDSDQILVFEAGQIVEKGTYEQLVAKKGFFYRLERGDQH